MSTVKTKKQKKLIKLVIHETLFIDKIKRKKKTYCISFALDQDSRRMEALGQGTLYKRFWDARSHTAIERTRSFVRTTWHTWGEIIPNIFVKQKISFLS